MKCMTKLVPANHIPAGERVAGTINASKDFPFKAKKRFLDRVAQEFRDLRFS